MMPVDAWGWIGFAVVALVGFGVCLVAIEAYHQFVESRRWQSEFSDLDSIERSRLRHAIVFYATALQDREEWDQTREPGCAVGDLNRAIDEYRALELRLTNTVYEPSPNQGAGRESLVAPASHRCPSPNQGAGRETA